VAAFAYSETAKKKILATKGKVMTLNELVEQKIPASKMILVK
jgi:ribosomal protein L18E